MTYARLLTFTLAVARSMILVVVTALSHLDSLVDFCEDMCFVLLFVSPTSFNICPFQGTGVILLVIVVLDRKLCSIEFIFARISYREQQ